MDAKDGFCYLTDENEDPFKSAVEITQDGIKLPTDLGNKKFGINSRWFIEGFGFIWLTADNGGEHYTMSEISLRDKPNLNYEYAKSRVIRNRNVKAGYTKSRNAIFTRSKSSSKSF